MGSVQPSQKTRSCCGMWPPSCWTKALGFEECHRLEWEQIRDGAMLVPFGKTVNARRSISLTNRVAALLDIRKAASTSQWVFPATTESGHIEQSSLKKQHAKACKIAGIEYFPLYTFRHTCLTLWSAYMDPYTLAYFAEHCDFATTRRYVHPNLENGREAMERARAAQRGHNSGHSGATDSSDRMSAEDRKVINGKGLDWYARADSNRRPFAPEANALSS